jgi:hypothetical protein
MGLKYADYQLRFLAWRTQKGCTGENRETTRLGSLSVRIATQRSKFN